MVARLCRFLRSCYESVSYVAERCTCDLFEVLPRYIFVSYQSFLNYES